MRRGDIGDRMYIPVKGSLGIWLSSNPDLRRDKPVGVKNEFEAVGELALKNDDDRRTATVACIEPGETVCLTLEKHDYQKLVHRQIMLAKGRRFTFLVKFLSEIFRTWSKHKILETNDEYIMEKYCKADDLIYDIGEPAETFYIVREG